MKLLASSLLFFNAGANSCGTPDLPIEGKGEWVQSGGEWRIDCENKFSETATKANIRCRGGKWRQTGPLVCFDPPPIPDFLEAAEILMEDNQRNHITCLDKKKERSWNNWDKDGQHVFQLYKESLKYLEGYARALTTNDGHCRNSDYTMTQTSNNDNTAPDYMCIMDRRDMRLLVKHIYYILYHPMKAYRCFHPRHDVSWMYSPGGSLEENSSVAQWIKTKGTRLTLSEFYTDTNQVPNAEVRAVGANYSAHFSDMVTGDDMKNPGAFPFDITANALPNLWACAGWVPMYAWDSARNKKNFIETRGSYAYAEILGHWGLLRIDEIDGVKVGAEIGMVAQGIDTFYPFHNHAIPEIYYTIREPACAEEFLNFAVRADNPMLKTISETDTMREVEFDGSSEEARKYWVPTSPDKDDLIYFHENTIHAFNIQGENCHAKPHEKAIVTVWARSMAHDRRNDYGTTLLCEDAEFPETPALDHRHWRCDLTKTKWRRSADEN